MVTPSQAGIRKPNLKYAHYHIVVDLPKEPKTIHSALNHDGWTKALQDEIQALQDNNTWTLVPHSPHMDVIGCKWVFTTKINVDSTLNQLKARLVVKGFHQIDGVNYTETFSPVIKLGTIRIILSIALVCHRDIRQLDIIMPSSMVISKRTCLFTNLQVLSILLFLLMFAS
ncbi:uncharacterized mitochondrial protein AtMg00820-like [Juglans microcarpa x Juglans regia]|uniref:uncharacterized mitochondrial protein AtMg00820-like n=1 Tax=Juglans microcarpa x Juglans regia TaxID=2249226 RepID=UPI001B7F1EAA|nr:uncharacterized mitochondrial protein AtMg00820-like [Juglans microcarpa x Juglans regia]